jgi:hypothetical protein
MLGNKEDVKKHRHSLHHGGQGPGLVGFLEAAKTPGLHQETG